MDDPKAVPAEERRQARQRVVAQVLVVDRVVLERLDQVAEIVRLRDEHPLAADEASNRLDHLVHVRNVCEDVCGRHHPRLTVFSQDGVDGAGAEERLQGRDPALACARPGVSRLDAEHAVSCVLKVREQRAVVGADVEDEIVGFAAGSALGPRR